MFDIIQELKEKQRAYIKGLRDEYKKTTQSRLHHEDSSNFKLPKFLNKGDEIFHVNGIPPEK